MIHLPKCQTDQLMQLISAHYPSQQILHISDLSNDLHEALYDYTKKRDFEYDLKTVGAEIEDDGFGRDHSGFAASKLDLSAKGYNRHAKMYENIFVTLEPACLESQMDSFFKKSYRIMKNAGIIAVIVQRDAPITKLVKEQLEKDNFVALNTIEIFDGYDVVTAKKMHGWGAYSVGF
ncbi:hypothetical protein [Hydrogenimonas sp.]